MSAPLPIDPAFLRWCEDHALVQTAEGWLALVLTPGQWEALCALSGFFNGVQGVYAAIKARQVGWTTLLLLWSLWKCTTSPGVKILWVTPKEQPYGAEVRDKWNDLVMQHQLQEGSGVDKMKLLNHSARETKFENGSRLAWHHVGGTESVAEAVGRSGTFSFCIVTEAAYPDDPELMRAAIDALRPALEKWGAPLMYDSTCNGSDGKGEVFYEEVQSVLSGEVEGAVKLLPWWTSPDYCDVVPDVEGLVNSYTVEERGLVEDFKLKPGQIAWRRRVRGTSASSILLFTEKYPERSIADAFIQKSGELVVDAGAMREAEVRLRREGHGALSEREVIAAGLEWVGGRDPLFQDDERGYFRCWITPSGAGRSWAGLDCSDGHAGSDWQFFCVAAEDGEIACILKTRIDKLRLAAAVQRLLEWYGCERAHIEAQGGGSEVAGYIKHGVKLDVRGIDPRELEVLEHRCLVRVTVEQTTEEIRENAISEALRHFEDGTRVPDMETLRDLRDLRRVGGRIEHRKKGHDDSVLGVGFAKWARRVDQLKAARRAGGGSGGGERRTGSKRGKGEGEFRVGRVKQKRYGYLRD